ncbi:GNAT family N-acetyltransferase [Deinococcus sp. Marseille-Q6407]|uniref:GNAT family N-acetyltransferase n=1 Tax=Deinococcus sp. Marseille-Q6407 TaxID=2969223 RepID=UPI0021BFCBB8|nr:GNAT family N-acetyltransferase [Deinococcus sp. Marseille-Q6407]
MPLTDVPLSAVNLRPRLDARDPAVLGLLALAAFPDPARLERTCQRYAEEGWLLLGLEEGGKLLGLIGLAVSETGEGPVTILHIAVTAGDQRRGLGRRLLTLAQAHAPARELTSETDAAAVGFYRACGFRVRSLGEKYPGVERFGCTRAASTAGSDPECEM